jgi:DNA-binding winged helix-turn-helix (wHTH) protein/tetratricopeptide (TPR) repeat protein
MATPQHISSGPNRYQFGAWTIDLHSREVRCGEERANLSWRAFEALRILIEAGGEVVTRETLMAALWPDVQVNESSLHQCIFQLRRVLDGEGQASSLVETVARRGYRLAVLPVPLDPVQMEASAEVAADIAFDTPVPLASSTAPAIPDLPARRSRRGLVLASILGLVVLGAGWLSWNRWSERRLADQLARDGLGILRLRDYSRLREVTSLLRSALQHDPSNALAHAGMGEFNARYGEPGPALELARKSVELDPGCVDCQAILGWVLLARQWNFDEAAKHLNEALRADANHARALLWRSQLLAATGKLDEALKDVERAVQLEPTNDATRTMHAGILYLRGNYRQALVEAERASGMNPANPAPFEWMYRSQIQLGDDGEAIRTYMAMVARSLSFSPEEEVRRREHLLKQYEAKGLGEVVNYWMREIGSGDSTEIQAYQAATMLAWVKDWEGALAQLERGLKRHPMMLIYTGVDPAFAPLRQDPRFQKLLGRIGLRARS